MRYLMSVAVMTLMAAIAGCVSPLPRAEKSPLTIVQWCDPQLGFGAGGLEADIARAERAVTLINDLAPDLVVIPGDMVNQMIPEQIEPFQEIIARLEYPLLFAPGNHDLNDPVTREGLAQYRDTFGADRLVLDYEWLTIVVGNTQLWREAPQDEAESHDRWFRRSIAHAERCGTPVIVVTHVPPYVDSADEPDQYFNLPESLRRELLDYCVDNGVFLWLAGHTHTTLEREYRGMAVLNGETTGNNFDGHPYGFRVLTVNPDLSFDWRFQGLD